MTVRDELYDYISENFLYLQPDLELTDEDRFLELGVIDSTGVVELVGEVEERYGITVEDAEITEDNFGSLAGLVRFVAEQARRGGLGMAVRTLDDHLRASAARTPGKTAIVAGDRRVSYGELDRLADGIAGGLIASGIERGDRVGVFLPNTVEGAASIYGVLRAGAAFSPLNPTMKAEKLGQVLADAGAAGIICESAHRGVVADARRAARRRCAPSSASARARPATSRSRSSPRTRRRARCARPRSTSRR